MLINIWLKANLLLLNDEQLNIDKHIVQANPLLQLMRHLNLRLNYKT
jgi:hypothetical protein